MNLSAIGNYYNGTYAALKNTGNQDAFPYSVKVTGRGSLTNKKSLFDFASVTLTEHMLKDKYGTKVTNGPRIQAQTLGSNKSEKYEEISEDKVKAVKLPDTFSDLKECNVYYHGRQTSEYELIQIAVAAGKMELPENPKHNMAYRLGREAFKVLVQDEAKPKYSGSSTLYSEDGKYTFTEGSNGEMKLHFIDDKEMNASLEDISNWIMSGTPNRNIETRYLNYLRSADPDLYERAQNIGTEVRTYGMMEDLYNDGVLSERQNSYDLGLLGMLFGKGADSMRLLLHECRTSGNYLNLLNLYDSDGAVSLKKLREEQMDGGGIV